MATPAQYLKLRGEGQPARAQDNIDATLGPIAAALTATPIMGAPAPAWVKASLAGGYSQTAAPQPVVAFHRDALGYVHTKLGLTHVAGCVAGTVAFTYPLALRPTETLTLAAFDAAGAVSAVQVNSSGQLSNVAVLAAGAQVRGYFIFRQGT